MNSSAALGAMLILVGLALAFLAAYVLLNRRREGSGRTVHKATSGEAEGTANDDGTHTDLASGPPQPELSGQTEAGQDNEESPPETALEPDAEGQEAAEPIAEGQEAAEPPNVDLPEPEPVPEVQSPELIPVIQIYREEVSGMLVLRSGDREYRSGEQVQDARDRRRIESALADLSRWFTGTEEKAEAYRRAQVTEGAKGSPTDASAESTRSGSADGREKSGIEKNASATSKPSSMLEDINAILKETLAQDENAPRGVSLVSDSSGVVRVLIGLKSYPMDEVPDEAVRSLIRQAVQEWEASQ